MNYGQTYAQATPAVVAEPASPLQAAVSRTFDSAHHLEALIEGAYVLRAELTGAGGPGNKPQGGPPGVPGRLNALTEGTTLVADRIFILRDLLTDIYGLIR